MTLGDFLKAQLANSEPWHCSTMAADWAVARGHPDFAAAWRDVFEPSLCDATAEAGGGLLALWDQGIGDGLPVVQRLEAGDIAVITAMGIEAGAIWTGERWAMRSGRGVTFLRDGLRVLKAWRP